MIIVLSTEQKTLLIIKSYNGTRNVSYVFPSFDILISFQSVFLKNKKLREKSLNALK